MQAIQRFGGTKITAHMPNDNVRVYQHSETSAAKAVDVGFDVADFGVCLPDAEKRVLAFDAFRVGTQIFGGGFHGRSLNIHFKVYTSNSAMPIAALFPAFIPVSRLRFHATA